MAIHFIHNFTGIGGHASTFVGYCYVLALQFVFPFHMLLFGETMVNYVYVSQAICVC